ncbi:MAG: hypothetical protein A2787_03875 [Omnitrophica WOR_2 bacterium RIFCSPHIGHO2_01_FULL_48_9]|nr:MAG: hypothetical protein A2787_03875 [Omnitrophica WOR_2 bacterium RIFCSPHIGHO2_01_FULL_48_9]
MFTLFYIGFAVVILGLGAVGWLLYNENKNPSGSASPGPSPKNKETTAQLLNRVGLVEEKQKEKPPQDGAKNFFTKILSQLPFLKKEEEVAEPMEPRPSLFRSTSAPLQQPPPVTGTASIRTAPQTPTETEIPPVKDANADFEAWQASQLKEKTDKLETLLNEKNQALEKIEKELSGEIKNHKEFNKVKDALEKELKDSKVRARDLQIELTSAETETAGFKNRVNQLELKVTKLEKTINELEHAAQDKDSKIQELTQKLQTTEIALKVISEAKEAAAAPTTPTEIAEKPAETPLPETIQPPEPQAPEPPVNIPEDQAKPVEEAAPPPPDIPASPASIAAKSEAPPSQDEQFSPPAAAPTENVPPAVTTDQPTEQQPSPDDKTTPTRQESLKHFLKHLEEPQKPSASESPESPNIPEEAHQKTTPSPEKNPDSATEDQQYIKLPPDILMNKPPENSTITEPESPEKEKPDTSAENPDEKTNTP